MESSSSLLNFHAKSRLGKGTNPFNSRKPTPRRSPTFSTKSSDQIIPISQLEESEKKHYQLKFSFTKKQKKEPEGPKAPQKPIIQINPEAPQFVISDYIKKTASYYFQLIAHKYPQYKPQMRQACATFLTNFNGWMRKKGAFAQMKAEQNQISPEEMESILARANEQILALTKEKKVWKEVPLPSLENPDLADLSSAKDVREKEASDQQKSMEKEIDNEIEIAKRDIINEFMSLFDNLSMQISRIPNQINQNLEQIKSLDEQLLSEPEIETSLLNDLSKYVPN